MYTSLHVCSCESVRVLVRVRMCAPSQKYHNKSADLVGLRFSVQDASSIYQCSHSYFYSAMIQLFRLGYIFRLKPRGNSVAYTGLANESLTLMKRETL